MPSTMRIKTLMFSLHMIQQRDYTLITTPMLVKQCKQQHAIILIKHYIPFQSLSHAAATLASSHAMRIQDSLMRNHN